METFTKTGSTSWLRRTTVFAWLIGVVLTFYGVTGGVAQDVHFYITKAGPQAANPGDEITYVIHFSNLGTNYATNVVVTDYLPDPSLCTYVKSIPAGVYNSSTNELTWTSAQIPNLASLGSGDNQIVVKVKAGTMGSLYHPLWNQLAYYMPGDTSYIPNYSSVTSNELDTPQYSDTLNTFVPQYCGVSMDDLTGATKSSTGTVSYFLMNLDNDGNISDNFLLSAAQAPGSEVYLIPEICDLNKVPITQSGWVAPGSVYFFYLKVTTPNGTPAQTFNLTQVTATSTVCPGTSTESLVRIDVANPLGPMMNLIKSDNPDPVNAGDTLTYTLFMMNSGKSDALNFTVTENYDPNTTFLSANPAPTSGNNIWNLPNLVVGGSTTITIKLLVQNNLPNGTILNNVAVASCTDNHGNPSSDSDAEKTTVHSAPDMMITKTAVPTPAPAKPGQTITYTLHYYNIGNFPATGVSILDDYDQAHVAITGPNGGTDNGNTISWYIGTVPSGGSGTITYTATILDLSHFDPGTTPVMNSAIVMLNEIDEDYVNNTATAFVLVNLLPNLHITKTATAIPAHVDASFDYVITISNLTGDMPAPNVTLHDTLPANLVFVNASDGGILTGNVVTWPLFNVPIGGSTQRTITVRPVCSNVGTITNHVWGRSTTTDANETDNRFAFDLSVTDNTPPQITCPTSITQNVDPSQCHATVTVPNPVTTDNCGVTTVMWTMTGVTTGASATTGINYVGTRQFNVGVTTVTYTIYDAAENTASCTFTVTVVDNIPPAITCPGNQVRNANNGTCTYTAVGTEFNPTSATDQCPGVTLTNNLTGTSTLAGYVFNKGITTVTWTAKDAANNTTTCSFTVTVNDNQLPTITCVSNQTRNANTGVCTYTAVGTEFDPATFADNCTGSTISNNFNGQATLDGAVFPKGSTTVVWTVTDQSTNTATCSFTVTVLDTQLPTISCPGNITQPSDPGVCGAVVTYTVNYSDNCTGATLLQTSGLPSGATFPVGTTNNTFKVTDASGNTATCSFSVTIQDSQAPSITCPGNIARPNDPNVCGAVVTFTVNYSDNCPGASLVQTSGLPSGSTFPIGTTTNIFKVTDASLNTASCSFTVTITDNQAPQITCPGNQVRSTNPSVCQYTAIGTEFNPVSVTDNCPGTTYINNLNGTNTLAGRVFPKGTTTVVWTATDAAGNTSSCSFTVTVNDTELPTIECVSNQTRNTDPGVCTYTAQGAEFNPAGYNDNCPGSSVLNNFNNSSTLAGAIFPKGLTTVVWTVTDASGNSRTCSFTVTVVDQEKPVVSCVGAQTRNANNNACTYTTVGTEFDPTSYSDNCPGATVHNSYNNGATLAGAIFPKGTTTVTWTVADASGNTASCSFTLTVTDNQLPTITCPGDQDRSTNAGLCSYTAVGAEFDPTATNDNCTGATVTNSFNGGSTLAGASFPKGLTNVTWTITDASGNSATCSFSVTVHDTENPTITCRSNQTRNTNTGSCTYTAVGSEFDPISFADNCPGSTILNNFNNSNTLAGAIFPKGTTTVTWTVTDASGNSVSCTFTVTVHDTELPVIACPGNQTRSTNAGVCSYTAAGGEFNPVSYSDNCTGATIINSYNSSNTLAGAVFPKGTTNVVWTVSDASGNTATCSFSVTVNDNENPQITCPGNQTRSANSGSCTYTVSGTEFNPVSFSDNCPGATIKNDYNNTNTLAGAIFPKGTTSVTWTVTDASGNKATCSFSVTVNDSENPTITCVGNQVRNTNPGVCSYTAASGEFDPVSYGDNCSGSTISNNYNSSSTLAGAVFPKGTTTVVWTVTDASGNSASCSFTVTVNDHENPVVSCPGNQTRNTNPGLCTYLAVGSEFNPTSFSDNCPGAVVVNDYNGTNTLAGAIFPKGNTTVTWTVTDVSGNSTTCSFTITVVDNENPTITCVTNQNRNSNTGSCTYTAIGAEFDPIAYSDNCPGAAISNSYNLSNTLAGAIFPKGTTLVTWTVTDLSGNLATCSFSVTVADNEVPAITCPGDQSRTTNPGVCSYTTVGAEFNPVGFSDNCPGSVITNDYNGGSTLAGAVFAKGVTGVIWTVTDAAGNTAACIFYITVTDPEDPTITCPGNIIEPVDAGEGYATIAVPNPITGDNCAVTLLTWTMSGATTGSSPVTGINYIGTQQFNLGTTTINYLAGDAAGNTVSCSFTITVTDNEAPTIICPANISQNVDPGVCSAMVNNPNPTITDNGVIVLVTWTLSGATTGTSPSTGINYVGTQLFNVGVTTVSYYVEDEGGNPSACSYLVTVTDNLNPFVTCPLNITQNTDPGQCQASVNTPNPATGDNCAVTVQTWVLSGATTGSSPATGINNLGTYTFNKGITTVLYTVKDAAGNTGTCSYTVTISDHENPTITCPGNQTRNTNAGVCSYTAVGTEFNPVAYSDNCPGSTVSNNYNAGSTLAGAVFPKGTTTVIWTVTDASGNTSTCSFTIQVNDTENPTITCVSNQVRNANNNVCTYTVVDGEFNPASFGDNCPGSTISNNYNFSNTLAGAVFPKGTTTVVWTVTDLSGNSATCSFSVTILDAQSPVITCPGNQARNTDPGVCTYTATGSEFNPVSFSDNCSGSSVSNNFNGTNTLAGAVFSKGVTTIIWTAMDASGNTSTCSFTITVTDHENPAITCPGNQVRSTDPGDCSYTAIGNELDPVTYSDNCPGSTIINNYNNGNTLAGAVFPKGITTIVWTVTDASGNMTTCSYTLTVNDNEQPEIACPGNQARNTNNNVCTYTAVGSEFDPQSYGDNCPGSVISNDYNSSPTLAGAIFPKGTTTVTWTITDASGNTATCSFTILVNDIQVPQITCTENQFRTTDPGVCTYTAIGAEFNPVAFSDNCPGSLVTNDYNGTGTLAGAVFQKGNTIVTWTVTDASGNTATCSFTVTVSDDENPSITCPGPQDRNSNDDQCTYTAVGNEFDPVSYSDNCPGSTILNNYNSGSTLAGAIFPKGTTTVTWTVTDASGNTATCTFTLTVHDAQDPEITCTGDQERSTDPGLCTYTAVGTEFNPVSFSDNCTGSVISNDYNSNSTLAGASFPKGSTIVVWTVTDATGNTATCSFTVTVNDNENPAIMCVEDQGRNADPGVCTYTAVGTEFDPVSFSDNCPGATILNNYNNSNTLAGAIFPNGTTTVIWTVTDASGNTAACSFNITVDDSENPTIVCIEGQSRNTDPGACTYTAVGNEFDPVAFSDNCPGPFVTNDFNGAGTLAGATFPKGITTVTWTVTDASGNTSTCSFTVTIHDAENPTLTCVENQARNTDPGVCTYTAVGSEFDPIVFADNCPGSTVLNNYNNSSTLSGAVFQKGVTTVVWTVTDASGNSATCSFTLTVSDAETPVISCTGDQTRNTDPGVCTYTALGGEFDPLSFQDNCSGSAISNDYNNSATLAGAIFQKGTTTIVWTVTDASGNTATCTFMVTVNDSEVPTITCVENQVRSANPGLCTYTAVGSEFDPIAFADNCTGATISNDYNNSSTLAGSIFPNGTTTVVWTVTDASGNTAACSFTVLVNDNESPYVACVEDQGRNTDPGVCTYTAVGTEFDPTTFEDNCPGAYVTNDYNNLGTLAGAIFQKGTTTITWTVTDASGNTSTCSFTLTVTDVELPTITCTANQVRNTDPGVCTYTAVNSEFDPVAFADNCTGSVISNDYNNSSTLAGAIFQKGITTIVWTATDASGNTATCAFTVTVNDLENPTITCVENQVRNADPGVCTYTTVGTEFDPVSFADNCTGSTVSNDYNNLSTLGGAIFPKGTTTVTWTVADASGNTATCSFTVTVNDNQVPTISCPGDQVRNTNPGVCTYTAVGTEFDPTGFADNCTGSTVSNDFNGTASLAGAIFPKGTTTIVWTVTDASGNTATCSFTLTVSDVELPVITCPSNIVQIILDQSCLATVSVPQPVISDNCPGAYAVNDYNGTGDASGTYPAGTTTVTWTVYDASGNSATCQQTITILNYPIANDDTASTLEDTPVSIPVLANDVDCENEILPGTLQVVTNPLHGTATVQNGSGEILYSPNLNYYGSDSFRYQVCNADELCDSAWVQVTVIPVNDPPIIYNENLSLCENTSLSGNVLANGDVDSVENTPLTVTVPQVSGPSHGTFTLQSNGDFLYVPAAHYFGPDMVVVSLCDNGFPMPAQCVNDTIFVNVMEAVTANAGADQELCNATGTTLSGSVPAPGTGNWTQTSGPSTVTITPSNSPNVTVTGMIPGVYTFLYTVTTGTCSTVDSMTVVNDNLPTPSNAGADQDLCLNGFPTTSTVMAANTPIIGTGLWAQVSGPTLASIANPSSPTTTISNLAYGVYKFTWSISYGVCSASVDTVKISVWYLSSSNAGPDATICEGESMFLEESSAADYLSLQWGTTGTGTFNSTTILHPTYYPSASDIAAGVVKLYLKSFGHAPCAPVADTMALTIIGAPTADAGPSLSTCQPNPVTITGASATHYSSIWWTCNGLGILSNFNTLTPTYTPLSTETGTIMLIMTVYGNSPCGLAVDTTYLDIVPAPIADAGPDSYSCEDNPFTIYNATASNYSAILWTENGPGYLVDANTLHPTYYPAPGEVDSILLVMQVWGLTPCGVVSDNMYLHYNAPAEVFAGNDLQSCSQNPVTLSEATAKYYSSLAWRTTGTGAFNDTTILHPVYTPSAQDVLDGSVELILIADGLGACPKNYDTLVLSLTAPPVVNAGEDVSSCANTPYTIQDASASNYVSVLWTHNGSGVLNNAATLTPTYVPGSNETGTIILTLTVQGLVPCAGNADQKTLTINPQAVVNAGPDAAICEDETYAIESASGQNFADVVWHTTGTGTFSDPLSMNPVYTPGASDINQGSVKLILIATPLGGCTPASDTMMLSISKLPVVSAGSDLQVCPGSQVQLDASASNYASVQWTANGIPVGTGTLSLEYTVPAPNPGVITMLVTVWGTGGCATRTASDDLLLNPKPAATVDAGPDQNIQPQTSATLQATISGGSGSYTISWTPAAYLVDPTSEDPTTVALDHDVTFTLTVTDNSSGCVASDTVTVRTVGINLPPVAVNDYDTTNANVPVTLDPLANDYDPAGAPLTFEILEGPFNGQINPLSDSLLSYTPLQNFEGQDSIVYVIYDTDAIPQSDTAVIYIYVGNEIPVDIHNVITPNGDGYNDTWVIDGIEIYPDNTINIFNRWGDRIRTFNGYNNTSVVWDGTDKHNDPVPDGTYFYILNIPHVGNYSGWVYLRVNSQ